MFQSLPLTDAELCFDPAFLSPAEAEAAFAGLRGEIAWETHRLRLFGREVASPRLSCWIGDAGAAYVYSGSRFEPRPWTTTAQALRRRLCECLEAEFNSVLANLYRDGRDGMGWHSDDEPELGAQPVIASLSLGATRRFAFKHRRDRTRRLVLELPSGSLLLMRGDTQRNYRHALPKTARPVGARINLTFRRVFPAPSPP
jgi:alkylated DNA repair dioxygenase AlkB